LRRNIQHEVLMTAKKRAKRGTAEKASAKRPDRRPVERGAKGPIFGPRSTLVAVAIIVVVGLVFFWRVLFLGEILTGGDVLAGAAIFEQYATEEISKGTLPLWNPYMFGGMPFFESMTWSAFVYPSFWINFVLEKIPGVDLPRLFFLVMHYLLAGIGTFFFLRSRGVGHAGATLGGVAFMLSPHLVGLATIGHGGKVLTAAYIPLVIMAAMKILDGGGRRWVAILALVGGLQFLARHVQVSYYTWLIVLVLIVFSLVSGWRRGEKWNVLGGRTAAVVAAGVLAAALAAVLLLPVLRYSGFSTRVAQGGGMGFEQAVQWSFHPKEILTFLVPSLFGLANETYWGTMPFQQVSHYVGYVVLALAAIAVARKRDRDVRFLVVLFAVGIVLSFGRHFEPLYRVLYAVLPGFKSFRVPALFLLLSQFAAAALAGHGASVLLEETGGERRSWLRWAIGTAAVGIVVGLIVAAAKSSVAQAAATELMKRHAGVPASVLRQLGSDAARLAIRDAGILIAFAAAAGVAIFVTGTRRLAAWICAALLIGIVLWDVGVVNSRFMKPERMLPLDRYYPTTPAVAYLKSQPGPFRIAPAGREFTSNAWMYHRIESIGGYHPAKLTVVDNLLEKVSMGNLKLFATLNVKYLVGAEDFEHPFFEQVAPGVHEYKNTLPRVFLIGDARRSSGPDMMLREYLVDSFQPWEYATVLDELPGPVESAEGSTATLVSHTPREIEVVTSIRRPCLLVFSEVYYPPGWKAFVDGTEVETYRTNYAFRSVYLESGEHTVVMRHRLPSLLAGLAISIAAAVAIAALAVLPAKRNRS